MIVWDVETGTRVSELSGTPAGSGPLPSARMVGSSPRRGRLHRPVLGRRDRQAGLVLGGHRGRGAFALAFDPRGKKVATLGWDGVVRLWDTVGGASLGVLGRTVQYKAYLPFGNALAFDADGRRLAATSDDGTVHVWDLDKPAAPMVLRGHSQEVNSVVFGPGDRRIATASQDQTIKLWDTVTGEEVFTLRGHTGGVRGIAISPDGRRIASIGTTAQRGSGSHAGPISLAADSADVNIYNCSLCKESLPPENPAEFRLFGFPRAVPDTPDGSTPGTSGEKRSAFKSDHQPHARRRLTTMFSASYLRDSNERRALSRPRSAARLSTRLETVEDRCLLSSYSLPVDLGTLGASNLQSGCS